MLTSTWGLVVASGKSERFGADFDTAFLNLVSRPVLTYVLERYEQNAEIEGVIVVAPKERIESLRGMAHVFGYTKVKKIVAGTGQRQSCVAAGLAALPDDCAYVSIHDGSRPTVSAADITETLKSAKRYGSGVLAARVTDAIKTSKKNTTIARGVEGDTLWTALTPQAFKVDAIRKGYAAAQKKKIAVEDDAEALELGGGEVRIVPAEGPRVRIASGADLNYAEILIRR